MSGAERRKDRSLQTNNWWISINIFRQFNFLVHTSGHNEASFHTYNKHPTDNA